MARYDVHGLVTVGADGPLPLPETLRVDGGDAAGLDPDGDAAADPDVDAVDDPDVGVEVGPVAVEAAGRERYGHRFFWDPDDRSLVVDWFREVPLLPDLRAELRDLAGRATLRMSESFRRRADVPWLLRSVLATRLHLADATFAYGAGLRTPAAEGVSLLGWNEVGKSSTAFRLVTEHGWDFLGDDKVVVHDGDLLPFGAIVGVSPGTTVPAGALSTRERVERRLRGLAGRLPLEHHLPLYPDQKLYLPPERLLPADRILGVGDRVGLDRLYVLSPADEAGPVADLENEEALRRAALCSHLKGPAAPPWHPLVELACYLDDRLDRATLVDVHDDVVRDAVDGVEAREVSGPKDAFAGLVAGDVN